MGFSVPTDQDMVSYLYETVHGRSLAINGNDGGAATSSSGSGGGGGGSRHHLLTASAVECDLFGNKEPCEIWKENAAKAVNYGNTGELYCFTRLKKLRDNASRFSRKLDSGATWSGANCISICDGLAKRRHYTYKPARTATTHAVNGGGGGAWRWVLHEFALVDRDGADHPYVLCRLRRTNLGRNTRDHHPHQDHRQVHVLPSGRVHVAVEDDGDRRRFTCIDGGLRTEHHQVQEQDRQESVAVEKQQRAPSGPSDHAHVDEGVAAVEVEDDDDGGRRTRSSLGSDCVAYFESLFGDSNCQEITRVEDYTNKAAVPAKSSSPSTSSLATTTDGQKSLDLGSINEALSSRRQS